MPGQINHFDFKGKAKAKAFLRAYGFLATILPYTYAEWEKLSIFLTFLVPKLPAPVEDDLSKGILEAIDMDSYRVEKRAVQDIQLPDEDADTGPVPTEGGGQKPEPGMAIATRAGCVQSRFSSSCHSRKAFGRRSERCNSPLPLKKNASLGSRERAGVGIAVLLGPDLGEGLGLGCPRSGRRRASVGACQPQPAGTTLGDDGGA